MNPNSLDDSITDAKLDNLRKYPELILEIGPWRSVALCFYCLNELSHSDKVLYIHRGHDFETLHSCCHCNKHGLIYQISRKIGKASFNHYKYVQHPLAHYVVRRRDIVTGYKKGWFLSKTPITVTETQLIESKVEPLSPPEADDYNYTKTS